MSQQDQPETEELSVDSLRELIIVEFLKNCVELKDLKQDFSKVDQRLGSIISKLECTDKSNLQLQKEVYIKDGSDWVY